MNIRLVSLLILLFSGLLSAGPRPQPTLAFEIANPEADRLLQQLLVLAQSADVTQQKLLEDQLSSSSTLSQLDSREEVVSMPASRLRLAQIFQALRTNRSPAASHTLIALTGDEIINHCDSCVGLLISALSTRNPLPTEALAFLGRYSTADSIFLEQVVVALLSNGSQPAVILFTQMLMDEGIPLEQKIAWLHDSVLQHRRNPTLVAHLAQLMSGKLPPNLRLPVLESLFDYQPKIWFNTDSIAPKPDATPVTTELRQLLLKIAAEAQLDTKLPRRLHEILSHFEQSNAG
ncbi:hypothetical protein [Methylomonas sp. AM2-LC]|uniref:hypothetical protein n=1 Tax=Methylomonas sp. AM2-LC TaxID=3153301 RepID=UPI003265A0CF